MNICIIPARLKSKRIPSKNIKDFFGRPIFLYAIETAKKSNLFEWIYVSTDSQYIARLARRHGACVFMRSKETASDNATTADVVLELLKYHKKEKLIYENVCVLYPCTPLTTPEHLKTGFDLLKEGYDTVFPIIKTQPLQHHLQLEEGRARPLYPDDINMRSQDMLQIYKHGSQWFWADVPKFLKSHTLIAENSATMLFKPWEAHETDTLDDWKMLEILWQAKQ